MNIEAFEHASLRTSAPKHSFLTEVLRRRWFLLIVALPTLLATVYYGLIASDIYVSQSRFVIKAPGQKSIPTGTLANLIQTNGLTGSEQETKEILDYLGSREALADLDHKVNVRARYANAGADFLSRFPRPFRSPSFENLYKYYQSMTGAATDPDSGVAVLEVRAFTPKDALEINQQLLQLSETLVNRLNDRAQQRAIAEAEDRVNHAQTRVSSARVALAAFRNQESLIDPAKQATGVLDISNKLVSEHAALQAQLDLMNRVAPANPSIPALRAHISAIAAEIAAQNARVVGTPSGIASKVGGYEKLLAEQDFAQQTLTAASAALEQSRVEAQKQQFYLERIVKPNLPDAPALPSSLKTILIVFGGTLCLYFIGWMLVVGVLEHSPEG